MNKLILSTDELNLVEPSKPHKRVNKGNYENKKTN